jgi:hypothetical protein
MRHCIAQPSSRIAGLGVRERFASRNANLLAHDVDTGDHFADAVLDLDARLDFGKVEVAGAVHQELHGAGVLKVEHARNIDGGLPERGALRIADRRRGRLLDELLVVTQQRTLTFAQVDDAAVGIGQHLHGEIVRRRHHALQVKMAVAVDQLRFVAGGAHGFDQPVGRAARRARHVHARPAPT